MPAKKTKEQRDQCRLVTPEFRVAYPHVFKPAGMKNKPNDPKKYSVTMLFPKDIDLADLKRVMTNVKTQQFGPKENWPKGLKSPVEDGDAPKHAEKEGYAGHWVVKASASEDQKPSVVDQNVDPIVNQGDFYPGCYARASVLAYYWDNEFGKGVGFILDHVQKTRDGKSFGGKPQVSDVFSPVGTGSEEDFAEASAEEEQTESFL